jgi:hypothetical protein
VPLPSGWVGDLGKLGVATEIDFNKQYLWQKKLQHLENTKLIFTFKTIYHF